MPTLVVTADGIGMHHPAQLFGLTVQLDTAVSTAFTCLVLLIAAGYLHVRISAGRPGMLQVLV